MLDESDPPMGIVVVEADVPIGWCALGPQRRYAASPDFRRLMGEGGRAAPAEHAWLLPCLFVREGHRGRGVSHFLIAEAVRVARLAGASDIEAWPIARSASPTVEGLVGREQVFSQLGFAAVRRPTSDRVVMRLESTRRPGPTHH